MKRYFFYLAATLCTLALCAGTPVEKNREISQAQSQDLAQNLAQNQQGQNQKAQTRDKINQSPDKYQGQPQDKRQSDNQTQEERKKQFEEMRLKQIAYFTERIGLTPEEAEEFWPVVNDIRDRRWKINHEIRRCFRQNKEQTINYEETVNRLMALREQESALEKECYDKLKKILSPEKLYKYYKAEEDFSYDLLRSFEQDKKQPQEKKD